MLLGYARVSKADGSQVLDLQKDALIAAGVDEANLYSDMASGRKEHRPGLLALLKAARPLDVIVCWRLDRWGRDLRHLVNTIHDLGQRGIGFKVLTGAEVDTTTATGRLVFGIFATLSAWEADQTRERTISGLQAARARGRVGGRPPKMTPSKVRLAMASMGKPETKVGDLCREIGVSRQTLYRFVSPDGTLREDGRRILKV